MRAWLAILFTLCLLAACYVVSALIYFDLTWLLIWITSLWAGIDSAKIELKRYNLAISCRPVAFFCLCALFWIFIFPWYLQARSKIKNGAAVLKEESTSGLEQQPLRRFFRELSKIIHRGVAWVLIGVVSLKIIFLLFCLEECWRGQRVWENYKHELEAKGESFAWDDMIPPPVPDAQNFFSAPMMSVWFVRPSGQIAITDDLYHRLNYKNSTAAVTIAEVTIQPPGSPVDAENTNVSFHFDDPKSSERIKELIQGSIGPFAFGTQGPDTYVARPLGSAPIKPLHIFLETSQSPNVRDLTAFFGNRNSTYGPLTISPNGSNSFRATTSFRSASHYLKWSDQFKGDFDLMRSAVKRPYARMDGDYHYPPTMPAPNIANLRAVSQVLAQRAQCYLLLGQPEQALQELTLIHDLRRVLEAAPTGKPMTLVASMINAGLTGLYADTIADGFRLHAWQKPQLVILQKQLGQIDLAPLVKESFHEEQVSMPRTFQMAMEPVFTIRRVPNATLWQKIRNLRPPYIFHGYFYFNVVNTVKTDQLIIDSLDPSGKIVSPQKAAVFHREIEKLQHAGIWQFYELLAVIAVPDFTKAVQTFAFQQTKADEAQIVCGLEQYRLAQGKYPETLDELVPQFIEKLPHDIIGGQPLKYHSTPDGQFILYSVGWNETDDGGQVYPSSYDQGDWVWP